MKYMPALTACLLALLAACSSSPQPDYYTLSSVAGLPRNHTSVTIKVRRPVIPLTIDRPEMVSQSDKFRITQSDNHLWSEPLDTMIERILAEDLRLRIPHGLIVTQTSELPVKTAYIVDVDIQQFGTDEQGNAFLQAQAVIRRPGGKVTSLPVMLHGAHVTSAESMAKTLSALLGQLADSAADKVAGS